jgi:hypothetical protein
MFTMPTELSTDEALTLIAQQNSLSEIIALPAAALLLPLIPKDTLAKFIEALDAAEIARIWEAAERSNSLKGKGALILTIFVHAKPYAGTEWKRLGRALISNCSSIYIDWFRQGIINEHVGYYRRQDFEDVGDFALEEILSAASCADISVLAGWAVAEATVPVPARFDIINILAKSTPSKPCKHPLTELRERNEQELWQVLSPWWEKHLSFANRKDHTSWGKSLGIHPSSIPESVSYLAENGGDFLVLPIGYFSGILAETPEKIPTVLGEIGVRKNITAFVPMATLWHLLSRISEYAGGYGKFEIELLGLRSSLLEFAQANPGTWIQALRWMIRHVEHRHIKADIVAISCQLGQEVVEELSRLAHDDDPAIAALSGGIYALMKGSEDPSSAHIDYLADSLAHYYDGTPKFPSPLNLRSATWISSDRLEKYMRDGVQRARSFFDTHLCEHQGAVEEALTATLLNEILTQFRSANTMLKAARSENFGTPRLTLSQREVSKNVEEPVYGCDLAFLIKAQAPGVYLMEWTDLVQVKKSLAMSNQAATLLTPDSWTIDIKQLEKMIGYSSTAVYFLLCAQGGVLVVPARYLLGFVHGKAGSEKNATRTLGYNDLRSAALPLEQYLIDLLIGQWIGTNAKDTMDFVKGNLKIRPRFVIDVNIEFAAPRG